MLIEKNNLSKTSANDEFALIEKKISNISSEIQMKTFI